MSTLIKRIIFIAIILAIAYGIYWLIDRNWADELKNDIVTTTQKTVDSIYSNDNTGTIDPVLDTPELFNNSYEAIIEKDIIVIDPEIKEPIITEPTVKQATKPKTVITTKKPSSSNILFDLFK